MWLVFGLFYDNLFKRILLDSIKIKIKNTRSFSRVLVHFTTVVLFFYSTVDTAMTINMLCVGCVDLNLKRP